MNCSHWHWNWKTTRILLIFLCAFPLTACNLFSTFDKPSGDIQILAAARAKLDDGDWAGAIALYQQLSSGYKDIAQSETAFAELDQQTASMENYAAAFGKGTGDVGVSLTTFAGLLSQDGQAGQTRRVAIFNAFQNMNLISDPELQAIVQFIGSISFASELLAEDAESGTLFKTDISAIPATCKANPATCSTDPYKNLRLGGAISGGGTLHGASISDINVQFPTFNMLIAALSDVSLAVNALTAGGKTSSFSSSVTTAVTLIQSAPVNAQAYRSALLNANVGM